MNEQPVFDRPAASPGRRWLLVAAAVVGLTVLFGGVVYALPGQGPDPEPPPRPEPYVQPFAADPQGEVRAPLVAPERFTHGPGIGGCEPGYGTRGECVPVRFPAGVANTPEAKCAWIKDQGAGALEVTGQDRHRLAPPGGPVAPSGNPYACPDVLPSTPGAP